jgi:hypothetical protein
LSAKPPCVVWRLRMTSRVGLSVFMVRTLIMAPGRVKSSCSRARGGPTRMVHGGETDVYAVGECDVAKDVDVEHGPSIQADELAINLAVSPPTPRLRRAASASSSGCASRSKQGRPFVALVPAVALRAMAGSLRRFVLHWSASRSKQGRPVLAGPDAMDERMPAVALRAMAGSLRRFVLHWRASRS